MGTARSKPFLRGLLVPDPRISMVTFSKSESSYVGLSPQPPLAEVTGPQTMLTPELSGSADGTSYELQLVRGGHSGSRGAAFVWRRDTDTRWRGWDGPQTVTAFEFIERTVTTSRWMHPDAATLPSGKVVMVVGRDQRYVVAWVRDPAGFWTEYEIYDRGAVYSVTDGPNPTIVRLPWGRLLCFFYRQVTAALFQVRMMYSDDEGVTWETGQRSVLESKLSTVTATPKRMRAAFVAGSVLLLIHITDAADEVWQYASTDAGCNFTLVGTVEDEGFPSIAVVAGQLLVATLRYTSGGTPEVMPITRVLASAWDTLNGADEAEVDAGGTGMEWGATSAGLFTSGECAVWADDDQTVYLVGRNDDGAAYGEVHIYRSMDGGSSWETMGLSSAAGVSATVFNTRDAATTMKDITVVAQGSRALLMHSFKANPGTADDSLAVAYLGGYTTLTLVMQDAGGVDVGEQIGWERTWLPYDEPDDTPVWTSIVAGTPTVTMTSKGLQITHATVSDSQTYNATPTALVEPGVLALVDVEVDVGTFTFDVRASSGVVSYSARVTVTPSTIVLRDLVAGADIATVSTTAALTGVQILMGVGNESPPGPDGRCRAWYRASGTGEDRDWVAIGGSSTMTAGATATAAVTWGTATGSATASVYVRQVSWSDGDYTGQRQQMYVTQLNPDDLLGRSMASVPVWLAGGTKIRQADGPGYRGDTWDLPANPTFRIEHIDPRLHPSPRHVFRNNLESNPVDLVWDLGEATFLAESVLGLYLGGINWRTATLYGRASGAWTVIATINTAIDAEGLRFNRDGAMVRVNLTGATAAKAYYPAHILAGSYFSFGTGQDPVRKIETNTSGAWAAASSGTTKLTALRLEGIDGTEATAGSAGSVWSKEVCIVVPTTGLGRYDALKLSVPGQPTYEGQLQIGVAVLGHVVVMGHQYDWGRALEWLPRAELVETRSGGRVGVGLGPTRRAVEVNWAGGVDSSDITRDYADPDYIVGYTGGPAVAAPADTPYTLGGLVELLEGSTLPVVYLPSFPMQASSGSVITITNRALMLYARVMAETLRVESVLGEEWGASKGEVFRVATVRLEEEV